jgi:hypothetical protein
MLSVYTLVLVALAAAVVLVPLLVAGVLLLAVWLDARRQRRLKARESGEDAGLEVGRR